MLSAVRYIGSFPKGVIFTLCAAIFWGSMAVAAQAVMANGVVNAGALVIVRLCSSGGLLLLWCCITARNEIVKIFTSWTNFRDVLFGAVFIYGGQFEDSANRMEAYYTARHLWEEAGKRLKGQIKGQTEKKKSETLRFQTSQWKGATIWIFSRLLAPLLSFNS